MFNLNTYKKILYAFIVTIPTIFISMQTLAADEKAGPLGAIQEYCKEKLEEVGGTSLVPTNGSFKSVDPKKAAELEKAADLLADLPATVTNAEARSGLEMLGNTLFGNPIKTRPADPMMSGTSMKDLAKFSSEGKDLSVALVKLSDDISDLDSKSRVYSATGIRKLIRNLPIVGTTANNFLVQLQSANGKIVETKKAIESLRDNVGKSIDVFARDAINYREDLMSINEQIRDLGLVKEAIVAKLSTLSPEDPKRRQIEDVVLFPMAQRISDLAQLASVYQQGVLSSETLVKAGHERVRQANRAIEVALPALSIGVKLEIGLSEQERLKQATDRLTGVTNTILQRNAQRLETHARETRESSLAGIISIETLDKVHQAMSNIVSEEEQFKREKLPVMDENVRKYLEIRDQFGELVDKMSRQNHFLPIANGSKQLPRR